MKILIADDDRQILRALRILLTARGYEVLTASTGAEALSEAVEHHPDLVMLDLGMPELNGIEVIEGLRGWSTVPILVVSGRTGSADKVDALDAGADDYVTKPFAADELLARIRALTRRQTGGTDEGSEHVRLTPTEWAILEVLLRNPRRLVTRQALLTQVWGPQYTSDTGYLRLYLAQLRKKLEPEPSRPRFLLTEPGMGYRFSPDED